ncbi:DapH/DapD/GlmU-related protein [Demequina mangrovi]|uniref:Putative colanic acid biosynthesis acetyltransferase WcaF n=1 Tax=Demequina mangrovi TaxID=1043493 RepID=A0A1H6ZBW7_9MICO|nr:DapH/DapD/GlmU-related protein [Demequina mangrovi]SEJ50911.1 putative colanic acid biosynthesis acetyltransferase WcaF [Demequina mangrovi]
MDEDVRTQPPVIPLADAPGERAAWGRSPAVIAAWMLVEWLLVTNALQPSSRLRVAALRAFGATIGDGVVFRQRTRVKLPWRLEIGDHCWIGEGVWIHNQDQVTIGHDAVVSQDTMLTTGSHAHRRDMALITRPLVIEPGVWVTSRCIVTGGVTLGRSCLVGPGSVVSRDVAPGRIVAGNPAQDAGARFGEEA